MNKFNRLIFSNQLFATASTIIFVETLGDGLRGEPIGEKWFEKLHWHYTIYHQIGLLVLSAIVSLLMIYYLGNKLEEGDVGTLETKNNFNNAKVILFAVSTPAEGFVFDPITHKISRKDQFVLLTGNITEDIKKLDEAFTSPPWNWTQILRGITSHLSTLKRVYLLGSDGEKGSHKELENCKSFIKFYFPNRDDLFFKLEEKINFNQTNVVLKTAKKIIKECKNEKFSDDEILVDITGGTKPTSIGMTFATIQNEVWIQYVLNESQHVDAKTVIAEYHQLRYVPKPKEV